MNTAYDALASPDLYPVAFDFSRRVARFVRMTRETYRDSVFLDSRTRSLAGDVYEVRLDDLLLAAQSVPLGNRRVHYILHTAYCCSTLLARYMEALPRCLVLKEPLALTQVALAIDQPLSEQQEFLDLCIRLLTRAYRSEDLVVIKPNDWCNRLGPTLLMRDPTATVSFTMTSLRHFLLSVLKRPDRREWAHKRLIAAARDAKGCRCLQGVDLNCLADSESGAYLWIANRYLYEQLASGPYASRVLFVNGDRLVDAPREVLQEVTAICGLDLNSDEIDRLGNDPTGQMYSKGLSRHYDGVSRREEMASLEANWGKEADAGVRWAESHGSATIPVGSATGRAS